MTTSDQSHKPGWRRVGFANVVALSALFVAGAGTASAATITPDTFADDVTDNGNCSLREAIVAANTDVNFHEDACTAGDAGADTINLAAGTYTLDVVGATEDAAATGDLDVLDDLTIEWPARVPQRSSRRSATVYSR